MEDIKESKLEVELAVEGEGKEHVKINLHCIYAECIFIITSNVSPLAVVLRN